VLPCATLILLWAALWNRFPLIFPDSGTYLDVAFGQAYALDRSSFYGFLLKPFAVALPGVPGLWLALAVQAAIVAGSLLLALRLLVPDAGPWARLAVLATAAVLTSLPWHAGQLMPDALTGPMILAAWAAASRGARADGTALLWFVAALLATTHYTHLVLLPVTAAATLAGKRLHGLAWPEVARRGLCALAATAAATAAVVGANAAALGRTQLSPVGPLFLFARLHEDGLTPASLDRHCREAGATPLCQLRPALPKDSQQLLWGGAASPVTRLVWHAPDVGARWRLIDEMDDVNRRVMAEQPWRFLQSSLGGGARQFGAFAALDDECPERCRHPAGGIAFSLNRHRPEIRPLLYASRQVKGETARPLIRAVTTPVAALALLLLPVVALLAWRRRDPLAFSLALAVAAALLVNALLAGALSDVHDRYQSRLVWLAPLLLFAIVVKWVPPKRRLAYSAVTSPKFSRSRISLPGLK
jgi:hypothetical protein